MLRWYTLQLQCQIEDTGYSPESSIKDMPGDYDQTDSPQDVLFNHNRFSVRKEYKRIPTKSLRREMLSKDGIGD